MMGLGQRFSGWSHPETYTRWRSEFAKALDTQRYTLAYLDAQVTSGAYTLDATDNAAVLSEIKQYPTGAFEVHGVLAAGDMRDIVEVLIPRVEAWAKALGAIATSISSRPGWAKALRSHGYAVDQVEIRKLL